MNLGFMTKLANSEPTYFVEKIWAGLTVNKLIPDKDFDLYYDMVENHGIDLNVEVAPKIHTIMEDKSNRWEVGNNIHFVINNRQPNRFQFAPVIKCTGVQTIEIEFIDFYDEGGYEFITVVTINGRVLSNSEVEELAQNDGFKNADDFFGYFSNWGYFKGKIIHWTNKEY